MFISASPGSLQGGGTLGGPTWDREGWKFVRWTAVTNVTLINTNFVCQTMTWRERNMSVMSIAVMSSHCLSRTRSDFIKALLATPNLRPLWLNSDNGPLRKSSHWRSHFLCSHGQDGSVAGMELGSIESADGPVFRTDRQTVARRRYLCRPVSRNCVLTFRSDVSEIIALG